MEHETGKKRLDVAVVMEFAKTYKAPLIVVGVILGAVLIDMRFRGSDQNYYAKGLAEMGASRPDKAIEMFSRALRQNPADPASRFGLGWAYQIKGWKDEALKQYDQAAKTASENASSSYFNAGTIFQEKRMLDEAITAYQRAVAINPQASNATYNLGFVYSDKGMYEQALTHFKRAAALDPKNLNAQYYAAFMNEKLGRKDDAKKGYQAILSVDPNYNWAKERLKNL